MRSGAAAVPPGVLVEQPATPSIAQALSLYLHAVYAIADVEWRRIRREPSVLLTRIAQPLLWLLVFGAAVSRVRDLGPRNVDYQAFIVPGVIAQTVLFIAIFSGLAVIWERDLGITQRVVVTPVARSAIVIGKASGAGLRALVLVVLVLVVVAVAGIPLHWTVLGMVGALGVTVLGAMLFSCVSMVIASVVPSREHFMGLGQLITLPLFFASNALYPLSLLPGWLRAVAQANPLTYHVELLRGLLLDLGPERMVVDLAVLATGTGLAVLVASLTYSRRVM
jgi:ABC-2 type transport system permease protein